MEKMPANTMDMPLMMKNAWLFSSRCDFNYKTGKEFPQQVNIKVICKKTRGSRTFIPNKPARRVPTPNPMVMIEICVMKPVGHTVTLELVQKGATHFKI